MALHELTGDGKTGRAPEKRHVKGVQGFLHCTSVKSHWRTGFKSPHQQRSFGSETNPPGAAGPSGLCAPQWESSTASSLPDSLPASERCSKTLIFSYLKGHSTDLTRSSWGALLNPWKQLYNVFCGSGGENNPDDVTMMSSGLSHRELGDYKCLTGCPRYKLEVWTLKDVGVYQAGRIYQKMQSNCIVGNLLHKNERTLKIILLTHTPNSFPWR